MNSVQKISMILILVVASSTWVYGQQKRSLTHADYDGWESIGSERISKDGKWVGYEINPQEGDGRLELVDPKKPDAKTVIPRASKWRFSNDDKFAFGRITPQADSVRALKLRKTKSEDMPKDSLFIVNLGNQQIEKLARVKSFAFPEEEGNWIAVHFEKELTEKSEKKDTSDTVKVEGDKKEKPKKTEGTKLLVRSLDGKTTYTYDRVKSFDFDMKGQYLYYEIAAEDTLKNAGMYVVNLKDGSTKTIDEGKTEYTAMTFSPESSFLAYLTTEDSAKSKKPYYDLFLFPILKGETQKIASKGTDGIMGMVSKHGKLSFSHDEKRLYFGAAPDYSTFAYEEDTTILKEERVSLDIWGWQDAEIQPMQLKNRSKEENKTYLTTFSIKDNKILPIADEDVQSINFDRKNEHPFAIGLDDSPYRRNYSWDIQIGRDVYLVNLESGEKTLVEENVAGYPTLSPEAKYILWYDNRDSAYVAYNIESRNKINLTKGLDVNFYDEQHDSPSLPNSYGTAGWLKGDAGLLVYDNYDIWNIDPSGKMEPINITNGEGRKKNIRFRRQKLDEEERGIDPKADLILSAFHETTKQSGYYKGSLAGKTTLKEIVFTDHRYYGLTKAEDAEKFVVRRSTYKESPDVYAMDKNMAELTRLSSANPKQEVVNWGSVDLVDYLANDGTPLQGLLFKPENFDASKKYPMMVYFYERNSDGLHAYRSPAPSASTINIPYFVSNGYVVFVPDIKYDLGLPGPSAYNCIIPGVQAVVAKGFVDPENMAIQGQSWGGYQVAYLITRTNMFKAAGAGAPVVNMTSAYGGIRWGTGMSRMFQYEQTQSRIGGTLWEKPLYYIENSPLFFMDRVETPVLIMHNDADGSVPWYQGIEMFMALKRLNSPAWLLQYNDEDHNLVQRKNRKDLSVRLSQFFDHYLKGEPAPLWMTDGLPAVEKGRTLKYEIGDK